MKVNPIIYGATGMVGEGVLLESLKHPDVESILVVSRRSTGVKHPKVRELLHRDFFDYSLVEEGLKGHNACFFCLGVSSVGMKAEEYRRTTYDLTMHAATTLARLNTEMTFCYVSGLGTDGSEHGRSMWARVKGKTENDLRSLPFKAAYAFRPGMIRPIPGQKNVPGFLKALAATYPFWKLVAPGAVCTLEDLGLAMIHSVQRGYPNPVLENRDIAALARSHTP